MPGIILMRPTKNQVHMIEYQLKDFTSLGKLLLSTIIKPVLSFTISRNFSNKLYSKWLELQFLLRGL